MEAMSELFYRDPYVREFQAKVLSCVQGKKNFEVILDDTAFYPEGGGQPADLGTLGGARVCDVRRKNGQVIHYVDRALGAGETVTGKLDWERRFDNMQNHTGEHLFSGLVHRKFRYENVGFHMADDVITVDFNGEITPGQLEELEKEANAAIVAAIPVSVSFPGADELAAMDYRSKKELTGKVRIVDIPGYDRCACCGTHVRNTAEIGVLKCLTLTRHRGGVRIEFVCGARALRDYGRRVAQTQEISQLLSAKPLEVAPAVVKLLKEIEEKDHKIADANARYFTARESSLAPEGNLMLAIDEGLSPLEIKLFCNALAASGKAPSVAVLSRNPAAGVWNYAMHSVAQDLRAASRGLNQRLSGRGGGSSTYVQGSFGAEIGEIRQALLEALG